MYYATKSIKLSNQVTEFNFAANEASEVNA